MTIPVPRTCTEITRDDSDRLVENKSRLMKEFRSKPAYVLLGDPGAGKTTAFEVESGELGEDAILIDARRFIRSDLNSHPEWRDKTLFIDGLDEVRAGSSDARTPLDSICNRLEKLGRPSFRISCREADWLGDNDRRNLATVSPTSQVTALRLDPLTDSDIEHILDAHPGVDDAQDFVSKARETGIEGLLANPQTLNMLADVVGEKNGWPASRLETFEQACRQMAEERNEEHVIAECPSPLDQTLDAAGHLCAVQLISGAAGFSLNRIESDADYPAYDACDHESPEVLQFALATRLFKGVGVGRFVPVHRHIAEFLAGRHLAKLIGDGLSTRRILSLIAGEDGVVVTEFRGMSAWLAAHCRKARADLIQSDPIGVGLYGDIREFRPDEKRKLILSLNREVTRLGYSPRFADAFGPLASPDMNSTLRDILTDPRRDVEHQLVVEFLLRVLQETTPNPGISQISLDIVRDPNWPSEVASRALYAFMHNSADSANGTIELRRLLAEINDGRVSDPENELLGILLIRLYPQEIRPSEVWDYLNEKGDRLFQTMYQSFWEHILPNTLEDDHVPELLDHLHERLPGLRSALEASGAFELPMKLLARGLKVHGEDLETTRLYNWLRVGAYRGWEGPDSADESDESIGQVRSWLERRPEVQKAVVKEGLLRCADDSSFVPCASSVWNSLHGSTLPPDFGLWSLERAIDFAETHPQVSMFLLRHAVHSSKKRANDQGLSRTVMIQRIRGHQVLETQLADFLDPPISPEVAEWGREVERGQEEDKRKRKLWINYVRSNADALRENRAAPALLHDLGRAYFGQFTTRRTNITPEQRIREVLGNDADLTEAALTGLRGALCRDDLPEVGEIIRLRSESRMHSLTLPFIAALCEIERTKSAQLCRLNYSQIEKALAFHYCTSGGEHTSWYVKWLDSHPTLVADILVKYAGTTIRSGEESVRGLAELAHLKNHAQVARLASLPLLRTFPVRCTLKQIGALDLLLWSALQHADEASLRQLIEEKLFRRTMHAAQRVHWLAAGVLLAPGGYLRPLESFVASRESRIRQLAAFFCPIDPLPFLTDELQVPALKIIIKLIATSFGPATSVGWITLDKLASGFVESEIQRLASQPSPDADQALDALSTDAALHRWHDVLIRARDRQRVIYRDAAYRHPSIEQICRTLSNQAPANPSDLAALVLDRLIDLAANIRTGNTDDWRQYWNEDSDGKPQSSKQENSCRDALLSDLRARLPQGVDAQPEGQYAGDKRADIRVSYDDFNVPVEVKKSKHPKLWSAARNQLIAKYTSDPATGGYGIYLVVWTGETEIAGASSGPPPSTAEELGQRLQAALTEDEARKISVCVVDVSPAGKV